MPLISQYNDLNRRYRAVIYRPLLEFLARRSVSPILITNLGLFLMIIAFGVFFYNHTLAGSLMILALLLDTVDGALARLTGQASDRGKFIDVVVDMLVYEIGLLTCFWLPVTPWLVGLNLLIIPAVFLVATVTISEKKPTDWIIHPASDLAYLKLIFAIPYFIFLFSGKNILDYALIVSNTLGIIYFFYYFIKFERRHIDYSNTPPSSNL